MRADTQTKSKEIEVLADPIRIAFQRIGVGHDKGYELINKGDLRTFTIGKRRLASRVAQAEFIARREAEATDGPQRFSTLVRATQKGA